MTPWLIYSIIIMALGLLFWLLMWGQNKQQSKRWLIKKIKQNTEQKDIYIQALNKLDGNKNHAFITTLVLFILIIPTALLLNAYLFPAVSHEPQQPPSIEEALVQLEQALQENPNDLEGQMLYARAMMSMQNFEAAVQALRKANQLAPNNADILTELAEAVAFKNNTGTFLGEPEQLINQALVINPKQQKALWLKGIIAFENNNYVEAEQLWTNLLQMISDDSVKTTIVKQINQARVQQNKPPLQLTDLAEDRATEPQKQAVDLVSYQVIIEASETVKQQQFPATTRVFVSAKAVSGPPMPVAAIDIAPPFKWPLTVTLTNQHNLTPNRQLSDFEQITLTAHLSISGDAGFSDYTSNSQTISADQNPTRLKLSAP